LTPPRAATRLVDIDSIKLSGENMRLEAGDLEELAESIRSIGLLQPLVLTDDLVLVCGHRRLAACRRVGLKKVPATVRTFTEDEAFVALFTENVHRKHLTPLEEALALKKLADQGHTGYDIAALIGKSQMYVSTYLALLKLDEEVQQAVHRGEASIWKVVGETRKPQKGRINRSDSGTERWHHSYIDRLIGWLESGRIADDAKIEKKLRLLYQAIGSFLGVERDAPLEDSRRCRHPGCRAILSRFNSGIYCGAHERQHSRFA
jgi:ParB/RepB/Spo0J family partition protein